MHAVILQEANSIRTVHNSYYISTFVFSLQNNSITPVLRSHIFTGSHTNGFLLPMALLYLASYGPMDSERNAAMLK